MASSEANVSSRATPLGEQDPRRLGSYTLLGKLGQGGMGTVYLGRSELGRLVAIKVVRADVADDPQFRSRFRQEAATARRVARVCTAEVLDFDPDAEQPYLVTEFIEGPTLATFVARNGPLADANLEQLAVGVAAALTAIHGAGIVHRDLKPSNVVLSPFGPRVIDFGIARALDSVTNLTGDLQQLGTPAFMSPEQITGAAITSKADVFAWGGLVAYAATGNYPFGTGSGQVLLYRALHDEPALDGVDPSLHPIVWDAMRKNPTDRPSARELMLRLLGETGETSVDPDDVTQVLADWKLPAGTTGTTTRATVLSPAPGAATLSSTRPDGVAGSRGGYAHDVDTEAATRLAGGTGGGQTGPPGGQYPPAGPPPGQHTQGRSRRPWVIAAVAAVAVVALLAVGLVALSGGDKNKTDASGAAAGGGPAAFLPRSVAPIGTDTMVYASRRSTESGYDLFSARAPGDTGPAVDEKRLTTSTDNEELPAITPDRRTIIYFDKGVGNTLRAIAADGSGTAVQLFTSGPGANLSIAPDARPSISPEGKFLVIRSTTDATGAPNPGLYIVAMDGSTVRRLDTKPQATDPAWSPDGERIAYFSNNNGGDRGFLVTISVTPGAKADVFFPPNDHLDSDPTYSPDGKKLAFTRSVHGDPDHVEVYVVDVNTKKVTEITQEAGDDQDPAFSPNGDLAFSGERGAPGVRQLYVTDPRNAAAPDRQLTTVSDFNGQVRWNAG